MSKVIRRLGLSLKKDRRVKAIYDIARQGRIRVGITRIEIFGGYRISCYWISKGIISFLLIEIAFVFKASRDDA